MPLVNLRFRKTLKNRLNIPFEPVLGSFRDLLRIVPILANFLPFSMILYLIRLYTKRWGGGLFLAETPLSSPKF
jgi:hypothetical protein